MSEGLAGGDFRATRLPILATVLESQCKGKNFLLICKENGLQPQQGLDQEPEGRNGEGGDVVEGLAVLDLQEREARGDDEQAADDGHLVDHRAFEQRRGGREFADEVEHSLPAEQDRGGEDDADAVGGREDHRGHEVEGGVRKQEGVVAGGGAQDGPHDAEGPYAEEQAGGDEAVGQALAAALGDEPLGAAVQVERRAEDAAEGDGQDKEHGEFALRHVLDEGVGAERQRREAHRVVEDILVFLAETLLEEAPHDGADDNTPGVDDRS